MSSSYREGMNYYEILEVPHDAPQHEIHKAYQRAKQTYAQDNPALYSMFTRDEAREMMKLIEEAYTVLNNHALRRNYDEGIMRAGLEKKAPLTGMQNYSQPAQLINEQHASLPDFIVPDPSIPGSFNEMPVYAPASAPTTIQPPAPAMDPLYASETGIKESILVTNSEFTVRKRETLPTLPADTARCPLGTYKIDLALEQEISAATDFDGPFLQKIRLYKQVSLEKLSVSSRIGKTYLIALESNDFKNLPATVFLRGFLVQIAKQLGLDESKVVNSYMNLAKAGSPSKYGP